MPGSTNFLQWNPGAANQENDAAYNTDTLRSGGATTAAILPSLTFNKFAYQVSIFVAAFSQMMANKGYSLSDANFANLVSVLSNVKTAAEFLSAIVTIPYATAVTFDAAVSLAYDLTLTGNVASSSLANTAPGQLLLFLLSQDATGSRSFVWPTALTNPGAICQLPLTTSVQLFIVRPSGAIIPVTPMQWITPTGLGLPYGPVVVSVNANGTVSNAYREIVEKVDASGGAVTRTLFTAVGYGGYKVNMKKIDATQNTALLAAHAGQTIDGQPNFPLSRQMDAITVISDNANWQLI